MTLSTKNISEAKLEEIRRIIVKLDEKELDYLNSILTDKKLFAFEIAKILPSSFLQSQKNGGELNMALVPVIEQVLVDSIASRPNIISDALAPIIGRTIRKSINREFKFLTDNFNLLLENTLSAKSLKWRYQSIITQKPYGEVVMLNTLGYKIEHILLIHKETGLLLNDVHASKDLLKDPNLISGMLKAIMDFAKDSIQTESGTSLETIEIGDKKVWMETSDKTILATVIKGFPPTGFREEVVKIFEQIQQRFATQLNDFNGDTDPFILTGPYLKKCLDLNIKNNTSEQNKKSSVFGKIIAGILLLVVLLFGFKMIREKQKWNNFTKTLNKTEGIYLTYSNKKGKSMEIKGMRMLNSPLPSKIAKACKIDTSKLISSWQEIMPANNLLIENIIKSEIKIPEPAQLIIDKSQILVSGTIAENILARIAHLIETKFKGYTLNSENANVVSEEDLTLLINEINEIKLYFKVGTNSLTTKSAHELNRFITSTNKLHIYSLALRKSMKIKVIGHSDNSGNENFNKKISLDRAEMIESIFIDNKFDKSILQVEAKGSDITRTENIPVLEKRRVDLKIEIEND